MLKRMVLPAALLISTLGVTLAPSAAAANRNDFGRGGESNRVVNSYSYGYGYGYNNSYRETSNSREWRERQERQERERREREWREQEQRGRGFGERDYYRR